MSDVLGFVFEYRRLIDDQAGRRLLTTRSEDRLVALDRLLGEPSVADGRRSHARCDVRLPAMIRVGEQFAATEIINLGGGGVCLAAAPDLELGDRTALRITSPETGRVYECAAEVCWRVGAGDDASMGLRFLGLLRELRAVS